MSMSCMADLVRPRPGYRTNALRANHWCSAIGGVCISLFWAGLFAQDGRVTYEERIAAGSCSSSAAYVERIAVHVREGNSTPLRLRRAWKIFGFLIMRSATPVQAHFHAHLVLLALHEFASLMAVQVSLSFAPRLRLWWLLHVLVMIGAHLDWNNFEPNIPSVDHHHFESGQSQIFSNHRFRFRCANSTCSLHLTLPQRKNLFLQRARDQIPQTS